MMEPGTRRVLEFAASQPVVSADQVTVVAGSEDIDAGSLLDGLVEWNWLRRVRVLPGLAVYAITGDGLTAVDSGLPLPVLDRLDLRRVLAAGWVWLRAGDGRFATREVLSARELLARDESLAAPDRSSSAGAGRSYGLRVAGLRTTSSTGLAYPDVLVVLVDGWAAVHVLVAWPDAVWLEGLLRAYGMDDRYDLIIFLVEDERIAQAVDAAARSVGVAGVVSARWLEWA